MQRTSPSDVDDDPSGPVGGPHSLLVTDSDRRRRRRVAEWVGAELATGAKVLYTGWPGSGPSPAARHWLAGPDGPRGARDAVDAGQLLLVDMPDVIEATGGRADALIGLQTDALRHALDEGWPRVAMSAESPHRPMGEGEAQELVAHERGITALTERWPVTALCQLSVPDEKDLALWETVGVHHGDLDDGPWSATQTDGRWCPRGELDAHVARRFAAALHAALAAAGERPTDPDLQVDMSGVDFLDATCAQLLTLAARGAAGRQRVVLHHPTRVVRRLVEAVEQPRAVVFADGGDR